MRGNMAQIQSSNSTTRADGRQPNQIRPLRFQNHIAPYATGSTLIEWGNTRVICGVTIEETVPRWMKDQNVTVENMLGAAQIKEYVRIGF